MTRMFLVLSIAGFVTLAATGCGGDGLNRGAVAGRVTLGGAPLAKGRILFVPVAPNSGPAASATIVDAKFALAASEVSMNSGNPAPAAVHRSKSRPRGTASPKFVFGWRYCSSVPCGVVRIVPGR